MNKEHALAIFEEFKIRRVYDEQSETWYFSVVDIVAALIQQSDFHAARKYWNKLKERLKKEGSQSVTNCHQLKLAATDGKKYATGMEGVSVKTHKDLKGLKTQNLRDHMSEAELIFTALAELSTRQIAESVSATGMPENAAAGKTGGRIAKKARLELEQKTGKRVVTGENFLPPASLSKKVASGVRE